MVSATTHGSLPAASWGEKQSRLLPLPLIKSSLTVAHSLKGLITIIQPWDWSEKFTPATGYLASISPLTKDFQPSWKRVYQEPADDPLDAQPKYAFALHTERSSFGPDSRRQTAEAKLLDPISSQEQNYSLILLFSKTPKKSYLGSQAYSFTWHHTFYPALLGCHLLCLQTAASCLEEPRNMTNHWWDLHRRRARD